MTDHTIQVHPDAVAEARAARDWYHERSPLAAQAFIAELDEAVAAIREQPKRWRKHSAGSRRYVFHRFPYRAVYRITKTEIQIVAIAHGRRRPGYWRDRVDG